MVVILGGTVSGKDEDQLIEADFDPETLHPGERRTSGSRLARIWCAATNNKPCVTAPITN